MICGSRGSKSRLAKAAGAEPAGQMRDEKLHAVVARSTFPSQTVQNTSAPDHFWKLRCRKSARRCGAKHISKSNVQSTPFSDHFWNLRCRKSARRCGAKHISKSKCTKHTILGPLLELEMSKVHAFVARSAFPSQKCRKLKGFGPLLEVEMSKKCTPLWREAHFEVKMWKHKGFGPLLDVQMSFRVAGARVCGPCQKWAKREGFVAFPKTMAGVGHLKRICKDAFSVAGAVQENIHQSCEEVRALISWEGLHFGASYLQVCWDDFAWQVQHFVWPGITFSWQVQYFRQVDWKNRKTHWYEAVSSALNFPFWKEVS